MICPVPHLPSEPEPDDEDLNDLLGLLPVVDFDAHLHFRKRGKYRSEISNLLRCQGGICPGTPLSPHIVQLLGADTQGNLVFPKLAQWQRFGARLRSASAYKRYILQLLSGLEALHTVGIIHRDIRLDNLVFNESADCLVICDLESRWGNHNAPEIRGSVGLSQVWTPQTDIYDLGECIKCLVYMNNPIMLTIERPLPSPIAEIVDRCQQQNSEQRPTLQDVRLLVLSIPEDET